MNQFTWSWPNFSSEQSVGPRPRWRQRMPWYISWGDVSRDPPCMAGRTEEVLTWLCIPIWAASGEVPAGRQRWWCHFLIESHEVYHVITSGQSSTGDLQLAYVTWEGRQCLDLQAFQEAQIVETLRKAFVNDLSPEITKKVINRGGVVYLLQLWDHIGWEQAAVLDPATPAKTGLHQPSLLGYQISTSFLFVSVYAKVLLMCTRVIAYRVFITTSIFKISACFISCVILFHVLSGEKKHCVIRGVSSGNSEEEITWVKRLPSACAITCV